MTTRHATLLRPRRPLRTAACGLALALLTWSGAAGAAPPGGGPDPDAPLRQAVDRALADQRLAGGAVSVAVADAATGRLVYGRDQADRLMPASNTKLLTSAAALDVLGADYRYRTDVLADGPRHGGRLAGDLYLRGTGDPTLLARDYDALAAEVAASGVRHVTGRLVADDTRFDAERLGAGWAADNESAYYAAQISALTVAPDTDYDAGSVYVRAAPGARPGDAPRVTLTPSTRYVTLDVRARTVAEGRPGTLGIEREHGGNTITVSGDIPVRAAPAESWTSVWEPTGHAAAVFADALARHGVRVDGGTLLGRATPPRARLLAGHRSMRLAELLVPFMKLSNNMHAEALTKTLGYETAGSGTWRAGLAAVGDFLKREGVDTGALRQVDGSGLSRMDLVPGGQLLALLTAVRHEPWFPDWYASLPVACAPDRMTGGTLRSRMCGTAAERNVRAKTGSLTGASALSGYVTDGDGRELAFSVVLNNFLAGSVKSVEDAVAVALASYRRDGASYRKDGQGVVRRAAPGSAASGVECSWTKPRGC
ncbi:D-alanyl-D-alanine carboxypeptidase/D-alanyl-D-alanine-endopeptidase [Streptomyces sp. B1866]|uniref:D-alanyl-D-alanine carboxypeptidase/D-alanyl-D-alanine endopeptidase n=1 Tax=Streptomyces sp. B1866 TaxID=3075431 RepID=UPI00288DF855|nr:D-alanyl-D-alanine carboxypeptidase/D-alanyl-D-alanine-endopeptidase [Streptomyces sp. B1866]MDT3396289.1 D-alanyl-D-alanine carboxypeptidase/D-alanyl-D-alanine-endopeptidase [Streptomyces sp. B1866]